MSDFDTAQQSLADLIGGLGNGAHDIADWIEDGIQAQVHTAALGMLDSILPPMVHGQNAAIRAEEWVAVEAGTVEIGGRAAGVTVSNTVLSGLVQKKIEHGVGQITANLDYTPGVNSIT